MGETANWGDLGLDLGWWTRWTQGEITCIVVVVVCLINIEFKIFASLLIFFCVTSSKFLKRVL